ncbi:MAG: signal peptidase I [Dehalococcoidia bacterium]
MRVIREAVQTIIMAVLIFLVLQTSFQSFRVRGASMVPNLQDGQYLLVNKAVYLHIRLGEAAKYVPFLQREGEVVYLFHPPRRGEVVVFHPPQNPQDDYIKRIIGLPGETVSVRVGKVYVDGRPLDESFVREAPSYTMPAKEVPAGHYFVLGDNRNLSSDSHNWGTVPYQHIVGKAWASLWPLPPSWAPHRSLQAEGK